MEYKLRGLGVFGIMLASSLTIMVGSAITPALPSIGINFSMGNYASWLVTMPALGVVIGAIPCGRFLNKHGAYMTCIIGLILYGALGVMGGIMPERLSEFIDRFLLGIATALVMTASTALISEFYKGKKQLKMIAIQGMAIELGGVIFLTIGGQLAEISWQMPYLIYIIAFVAFILIKGFVPSPKNEKNKARHEQKEMSVDHKETGQKNINAIFLLAFLGMLIFFTAIVSLPDYLEIQKGYTAGFTGNYLAAISIVAVCFAGIMPRIVEKFSPKTSLTIAYFCYFVGHCIFYFSKTTFSLYVAVLFMGIGFGFSTPLVNNLTVERSSLKKKAIHLSYYSMATFLGQFLSSFMATITSGNSVFFVAAILAMITCIGTLLFFDRRKGKDVYINS